MGSKGSKQCKIIQCPVGCSPINPVYRVSATSVPTANANVNANVNANSNANSNATAVPTANSNTTRSGYKSIGNFLKLLRFLKDSCPIRVLVQEHPYYMFYNTSFSRTVFFSNLIFSFYLYLCLYSPGSFF